MPPAADRDPAARPLFGADHRLRRQRDIDAAFRGGDKFVNRQLVVWMRPTEEAQPRLGLSVSRKVGGAVLRNRVKRCLREAFRRLSPGLGRSWDTMVVVRPASPPLNLAEATSALAHIFARREGQGPGSPPRSGGRSRGRRKPAGNGKGNASSGSRGRASTGASPQPGSGGPSAPASGTQPGSGSGNAP